MVKSQYSYISGKQLIKKLDVLYGVDIVSKKGSHIKVRIQTSGKKTIIPDHKALAYGTFSAILSQLELDEEIFLRSKGKL